MHDIKLVRADPEGFDRELARREIEHHGQVILAMDERRREAVRSSEAAQQLRNDRARAIGIAKSRGDTAEIDRLMLDGAVAIEGGAAEAVQETTNELNGLLSALPNILDQTVPSGTDETQNVEMHRHGTQPSLPNPRQHFELGEALGLMDFATAARLSGSRFVVLRGSLARLERALGQWMLDQHTAENGYTEISPPLLVNYSALYGTGQMPKFKDDLFRIDSGSDEAAQTTDKYLIPTAEVPLTNLVAQQIIAEPTTPWRFTALTPSFRSEAGSAGRDTRGMLRQHQFHKVEMVSITRPEDSEGEHERMTRCAEAILTGLGLTWRRMLLCAGDTGFSAAKTYDLEVWLPGQQAWREISSCSNCRDFQARRMNARFKRGKESIFAHTLNGSGVAVGRALIAVMETFQQPDGSIAVPEVLHPYMGGLTTIR